MKETLYKELVKAWFEKFTKGLNTPNSEEKESEYLFQKWLTPVYSVNLKWSSLRGIYKKIMADVVSLNSSLPVKKRQSITTADGDVPKIAIEKALDEQQLPA